MKKYIHILSFLALITCGNLGNAEKRINNATKSTHIGKSKDYFKNPEYTEDDFDRECAEKTEGDLVEIRDCTFEDVDRIQAEVLKKAKLIKKENIYNSIWINKRRHVIRKKCIKKFQEDSQIADINIAACIRDGMYALGRSIK
ncbi:MAG: hypothetical protein WDW19_05390 [Neisseriaceae bacterium]